VWKDRLQGYITHVEQVFFSEDSNYKIMIEYACEMQHNCNKDQRSFKAYLSRWLAIAAQIAPFTTGQIMPLIQASSYGAMSACIQAADGVHCGRKWNISADDGERDIGNQMAAMSIVQSNLILKSPALADITTGISLDNPNKPTIYYDATRVFTTGEKAGAWTFTALVLAGMFFGALLLPFEHGES
jgi:mannan endo-1,6-alpha-mannosidase